MTMTIEEQLNEYLKEKSNGFGLIAIPPEHGRMTLAETFSSAGFIEMINREAPSETSRFDILTNLSEYVPLVMCANVNVRANVILESFQTCMKNFDRGAAYPLLWVKRTQRRGDYDHMKSSFFSYFDTRESFETSASFTIKSNCLMLAVRDMLLEETRMCICAAIKQEDYKFVMALRRHGKGIPRELIKVFMDDSFDTIEFSYQNVRDFYKKKLRPTLLESGVRIERASLEFMRSLIYRPEQKFQTFDEMKEKREQNWRALIHTRE